MFQRIYIGTQMNPNFLYVKQWKQLRKNRMLANQDSIGDKVNWKIIHRFVFNVSLRHVSWYLVFPTILLRCSHQNRWMTGIFFQLLRFSCFKKVDRNSDEVRKSHGPYNIQSLEGWGTLILKVFVLPRETIQEFPKRKNYFLIEFKNS